MSDKKSSTGIGRALTELEKERARVSSQLETTAVKIERNPITALNLRFDHRTGFSTDPVRLKGKFISAEVFLQQVDSDRLSRWTPEVHHLGQAAVRPVGQMLASWGYVIAVEVSNAQPDTRLDIDWGRSTKPGSPSVSLVDPVNNGYLRLVASSLAGEVLPGIPRTGLLVFERPTVRTDRLQLHFSGTPVGTDSSEKSRFSFEYASDSLPELITRLAAGPSVAAALGAELDRQVSVIRQEFLRQQSGCLPAAGVLLSLISSGLVAILLSVVR